MPITQILLTARRVTTYTLSYGGANNVNEGSAQTFNAGGTNIANGTYYWTIETNAGDFTTTSGDFTIIDNSGSFTVTPTEDVTTEGLESYTVAIRSGSITGPILATSGADINDTSQTPGPTYTLTPDADNVDEGSSLTFTVGGSNIADGTYYWAMDTNPTDFTTRNGTVTITSNAGSFSITPNADARTDGAATVTVTLRSGSISGTTLATSTITINDTSLDPTYTLTPDADNVNEGSELTFTVGGTDITNGTYYWTVTNSGDFGTASGEFEIASNSGSFGVTPTADTTTEGSETFTVSIRSGSISGTVLQTSESITINDTSLAPVPPFSLEFTGESAARRLAVQYFQSDWNLNDTWTIEFWSKTNSAYSNGPSTIMSQADSASSIDVYYESGNLVMSNGTVLWTEPPRGSIPTTVTGIGDSTGSWESNQGTNISTTGGTGTGLTVDVVAAGSGYAGAVYIRTPGSGYTNGDVITATNGTVNGGSSVSFTITVSQPVWTHVAISSDAGLVKVYYNGIQQSSAQRNLALTDSTRDLYIGRRGNNNFQYFNGELALIRISEVARYATAFSPSVSYGVDADTLLFLGTDNPLADLSTYQLNGVATVANGGGIIYFAKSAYPDLDKQIQAGNTVVNADTSASAIVTAAVYTPDGDPDNWGVNVSPSFVTAVNTANFSGIRHTVTNTGVVRTNDVPSFQSLVFNYPQQDYLVTPASADWNLGTTWTIEFWINANNGSLDGINIPGGQWGLFNQTGWYGGMANNSIIIGLAGGKLTVGQGTAYDAIEFAEPTAQQWTHVAVVNNGGGSAQKVYYNGVEQAKVTGNYLSNGWTNATDPLYIGRLAPGYNSPFDGKMAMIRISNTAKYLSTFSETEITTYGVEADTVLFLDKVNPLGDSSASDHVITNNGVATSTSFPQTFIGLAHPYSGGTFGLTYCLANNPRFAEAAAIPIGARITSNIAGFGIRTVQDNIEVNGVRYISYDATGLTGMTSSSHVFNFYW